MAVNFIIKATADDILNLCVHEGQAEDALKLTTIPNMAQDLVEVCGCCYKIVCDGKMVGVSGIIQYRDDPSKGYAWSLFAKESGKYMKFIHRMSLHVMSQMDMDEIHTVCSTPLEERWCKMMGFVYDEATGMYVRTTRNGN